MDILIKQHPFKIEPSFHDEGFPGSSEVKASAWNLGDPGSVPGSGRSPREGNSWRIPRTEEPGRLQSMGLQSDMTE